MFFESKVKWYFHCENASLMCIYCVCPLLEHRSRINIQKVPFVIIFFLFFFFLGSRVFGRSESFREGKKDTPKPRDWCLHEGSHCKALYLFFYIFVLPFLLIQTNQIYRHHPSVAKSTVLQQIMFWKCWDWMYVRTLSLVMICSVVYPVGREKELPQVSVSLQFTYSKTRVHVH